MGLFGLNTSEAVEIARQYNKLDEQRNDEHIAAINGQTAQVQKLAKEIKKSNINGEIELSRFARMLESFITFHIYDSNNQFSCRASDISNIQELLDDSRWRHDKYTKINFYDGCHIKVYESVDDVNDMINESIRKNVNILQEINK